MEVTGTLFSVEFQRISNVLNEKNRKNEALHMLRAEAERVNSLFENELQRLVAKLKRAKAATSVVNGESGSGRLREQLADVVAFCDMLDGFQRETKIALGRLSERFDWLVVGEIAHSTLSSMELTVINDMETVKTSRAWAVQNFAGLFCDGSVERAEVSLAELISKRRAGDAIGWLGFFVGCCLILLVCLVFGLAVTDLEVHPLWHAGHRFFRMLILLALYFMLLSGALGLVSTRAVDYAFVFGVHQTRFLRARHYALVAGQLGAVGLTGAVAFVLHVKLQGAQPDYTPKYWLLATAVAVLAYLLNPLKVGHRSSRMWLLRTLGRIVTPVFRPLEFRDFWLADQLTSLVVVLGDLGYAVCFFSVDFIADSDVCSDSNVPLLRTCCALLPFSLRFLQCLRRFYDFRLSRDLVNATKYLASILLIFFAYLHGHFEGDNWGPFRVIWVVNAVLATLMGFSWDVLMDWGVGRPKFWFLRRHVILPRWSYYVAIPANLCLRSAWLFTVAPLPFVGSFYQRALEFSLAFAEIGRRNNWNVFRLSNEHTQIQLNLRETGDSFLPHDTYTQEKKATPLQLQRGRADGLSEFGISSDQEEFSKSD